jgi:hypothetical protein
MDDLPTMDLAEEAQRYGLMYSFLLHALLVGGDCVDLTPFADGAPLGQLTTVGVYCSDTRRQWTARSQWASKPHGPGCQHHRNLRGDDDLLALGEWIEPLSAAGDLPGRATRACVAAAAGSPSAGWTSPSCTTAARYTRCTRRPRPSKRASNTWPACASQAGDRAAVARLQDFISRSGDPVAEWRENIARLESDSRVLEQIHEVARVDMAALRIPTRCGDEKGRPAGGRAALVPDAVRP